MALQLARLTSLLQNIQVPAAIQPRMVQLPLPPKLEGALEPNGLLAQAQKHAFKKVFGPESMVVYKGYVYTGQIDGWIVEINPFGVVRKLARLAFSSCGRRGSREGACGRPMGLRLDSLGFLIVADAYHGIFRVNPKSGRYRQLVNPRLHWVNKRPLGYINDLAVSKDGVIFFTSSSTRWTAAKEINIILEGENTGRVLFYNPRERSWDKQVQELVVNMSFPNGLQLSEDESYLLVAEGALSRIHRVWLGPKPPVPDRIELFASNLPGVVDNIRRSPRGTFWVGISQTRHRAMPSVLDVFGRKPQLRGAFITLINTRVAFRKPRYGMVVELNEDGQVIRSLQDPLGKVYRGVSEVQEENGILFIASPDKTFIGFMKLPSSSGTSSSTGQDDGGTGSTGSPGSSAGSTGSGISGPGSGLPFVQNPRVMAVLRRIQENTMKMTAQRVRQVVMLLVKQLILAKRQTFILRKMAEARERDLQRIKEALRQLQQHGGHGAGSLSTTTSAYISTAADSTTASATAEPTTTAPSEVVVTTTASDATTTAAADSTTTAGSGTSQGTTLGSTEATESTTALGAGETTTVADTTSSTEAETTTTDASTSTAAAADTTTTDASAPDTTSTAIPETTTTEELTTSSFGE